MLYVVYVMKNVGLRLVVINKLYIISIKVNYIWKCIEMKKYKVFIGFYL